MRQQPNPWTPRYCLCPGSVISRTDGQAHVVTATQLAQLYGLGTPGGCRIARDYAEVLHAQREGFLTLRPRYDGQYRVPKVHELKVADKLIEPLASGRKTYEIRVNDRDFRTGDVLWLRGWQKGPNRYTGESVWFEVTYISEGVYGLPPNLCVLALARWGER